MRAFVILLFLFAFAFDSNLCMEADPMSRRAKKQKKGRSAPKMSKKNPSQQVDLGRIEPGTTFTCSPNRQCTGECGSCPAQQQPDKNPTDQPAGSPSRSPEATDVLPTDQPAGSPSRSPETTDIVEYQITAVDRPFDDPSQVSVPTQVFFSCSTSVSEVISSASCGLEFDSFWKCTALPNVIPNAVFAQVRCESAGALVIDIAANSVFTVMVEKNGAPVIVSIEDYQCITGVNAVTCTSNIEFQASSVWRFE